MIDNRFGRRSFTAIALLGFASLAKGVMAQGSTRAAAPHKQKVIFQVSDADPKKWSLALYNAANVQEDLGKQNVSIEIVAYGPGIGMLKADAEIANRVLDAMANGVEVVACENTMMNLHLTRDDMISRIGFAKAGVVEIMKRQQEGYAYIKP
jgi:intracellular sulfur oxidation DsrE/DsrF family protein